MQAENPEPGRTSHAYLGWSSRVCDQGLRRTAGTTRWQTSGHSGITILELAHGHAPFARFPPMKVLLMTIQNPPPTLDSASESAKKHFSKVRSVDEHLLIYCCIVS